MAILKIIESPDPILKLVSSDVDIIDSNIKKLSIDMLDTMYEARGIGLAAVQVGVLKRIIVIDVEYEFDGNEEIINKNPLILINPQIIESTRECKDYNEGCLSFPESYVKITRPDKITIGYFDENGRQIKTTFDGIRSVCAQHEIDHLNGLTIVDHAS
jgi:peptide deformylase